MQPTKVKEGSLFVLSQRSAHTTSAASSLTQPLLESSPNCSSAPRDSPGYRILSPASVRRPETRSVNGAAKRVPGPLGAPGPAPGLGIPGLGLNFRATTPNSRLVQASPPISSYPHRNALEPVGTVVQPSPRFLSGSDSNGSQVQIVSPRYKTLAIPEAKIVNTQLPQVPSVDELSASAGSVSNGSHVQMVSPRYKTPANPEAKTMKKEESGPLDSFDEFEQYGHVPEEVVALQQLRGHGAASRVMNLQENGYPELTNFLMSEEASAKLRLYAGNSKESIHAMDFWNIHGAKVYTYSGLGAHGDPNDTSTACGILMLDRYAIQERVGDPASPFTWWPYQAFFVIPKGVDFAKCKEVGFAGKAAATSYPSETQTICNGLDALALVAVEEGKTRLFVTGDCGYYSLGTLAFIQILLNMGWVHKGDACMGAPCFRVRDNIDVYLCLGTPQMIATPDPTKNIVGKTQNCTIIYSTADLRGWYGGWVLNILNAMYPHMNRMKLILRFNEGIPWGMMLAWHPESQEKLWRIIADQLIEFEDGNTAFVLGMYVAWASKPDHDASEGDHGPVRRKHWANMPKSAKKILEMIASSTESKQPFQDFMKLGILSVFRKSVKARITRKTWSGDPNKLTFADLTAAEALSAFILMLGRSEDVLTTGKAFTKLFFARTDNTIMVILNFEEGVDALPGKDEAVTCAGRYCDWYCRLMMRLNKTIVRDAFKTGTVNHAIDGENVYLLDALYIPGFGLQVAEGLTVWCQATFFCSLSRIYGGFAKLVQEETQKEPVVFHHECTELFQFTPFIQQFGMPVIDAPTYMVLAAKSTDKPLKFKRWSYDMIPAAMIFADGKWYRDSGITLRTPDHLAQEYRSSKHFIYTASGLEDKMWDSIEKGAVLYKQEELGCGPGEVLYVESTALVKKYIAEPHMFRRDVRRKGSVQYAP